MTGIRLLTKFFWEQRNLTTNSLNQLVAMLVGIVSTPFIIRFLGIEAFGLLGFLVLIAILFRAMDLGLLMTASREIARLNSEELAASRSRFFKTFETAFVVMAIAGFIACASLAPLMADRWIDADTLSRNLVITAVILTGGLCAFQHLGQYYQNCLTGIEYQAAGNIVRSLEVVLAAAVGLGLIYLFKGTVVWLIAANLCFAILAVATLRYLLLRRDNTLTGERVAFSEISSRVKLSGPLAVISLLSLVIIGVDRFFISAFLPLTDMGYYALASSLTMAFGAIIVAPMFSVTLPRLTAMMRTFREEDTYRYFRFLLQLLAAVSVGLAVFFILYSDHLILVWTHDATAARKAAPIVSFMVVGSIFNAWASLYYAYQLACGVTKVAMICNIIAAAVAVVSSLILVRSFGLWGAAFSWPLCMAIYFFVSLVLSKKIFPVGTSLSRQLVDMAVPSMAAGAPPLLIYYFTSYVFTNSYAIIVIGLAATTVGILIGLYSCSLSRKECTRFIHNLSVASNKLSVSGNRYAQFGEDEILADFFKSVPKGFFVDVGANDGITGSNSALLAELGWTGILVEPNTKLAEQCTATRPESKVFAVAAVAPDSPREVVLYEYDGQTGAGDELHALSRVGALSEYHDKWHDSKLTVKQNVVPARTLNELLEECSFVGKVDLLSIDVEGLELQVLQGITLRSYQPRVIILEDNTFGRSRELTDYMQTHGYIMVHRTGVNMWFVTPADFPYFRMRWVIEKIKTPIRHSWLVRLIQSI